MQKYELLTHELPPFFDAHSEILILGSFPSPKSRETGFYYGHPQNRFWKVLAAVFNCPTPVTIEDKKSFLMQNHIALWDVIESCEIVGASDSSIKNPIPNNLNRILQVSPIRAIFCTGQTSFKLFQKLIEPSLGRQATCLPSPSPANCATSLEKLIETYKREILNFN